MTAKLQAAKDLVQAFYTELDTARGAKVTEVMERYVAPDYLWRGFHPFHEQTGPRAVSELFWQPLHNALTHTQRRMDVFMAGHNAT